MPHDNESSLTPAEAVSILGHFFPSWKSDVSPSSVTVKKLSGGLLNTVYAVSTTTTLQPRPDRRETPQKVVVRKSGEGVLDRGVFGLLGDDIISKSSGIYEVVALAGLASKGLAPTLFGVFDGTAGRVEILLEGRTLTMEDIKDERGGIAKALAEGYARFHSIDLPLPIQSGSEGRIFSVLKFLPVSKENEAKLKAMGHDTFALSNIDWDVELLCAEDKLRQLKSPIVINHYDSNFLNIWVRDKPVKAFDNQESPIVFLDFELVKYIYRAVDLGGHFVNRMIKADNLEDKRSGHPYPSLEERKSFLEAYLKETERIVREGVPGALQDFDPKGRDSLENILHESRYGSIYYAAFYASAITALMDNAMSSDPSVFGLLGTIKEFYLLIKKEIEETEKRGGK